MPVSQLALAEVAVEVERRGDRFLLRSGHALPPGPERLGDLLRPVLTDLYGRAS